MSIGKFVCVPLSAGLLFSSSAYALEGCVTPPSCEELGFTANVEDCTGSSLKCPWDLSKAACKSKSAEAPAFILYGDGTVTKEILADKTPIGIVFDETNKLAVALTDIKKDGSAGSDETIDWTNNYDDIPNLANCVYDENDTAIDSCSVDGRTDTDIILNCGNICGGTMAASVCNIYNPSGCTADFCKQTQWFLPSMRDLANIYNNKSGINASLSLLSSFGAKTLTENYYWSSTEYGYKRAWAFGMYNGFRITSNKNNGVGYHVRPVVYYGEPRPQASMPILYGDGLVTKYILSDKTPIGIVFDETKKLAVALTDVTQNGSEGSESMPWTSTSYDIPSLTNCEIAVTADVCAIDGRANTDAILGCGSSCGTTYVANAVNAYNPSGCTADFCKKNKWFLPSDRDLRVICNNKTAIEDSLTMLSGSGATAFGNNNYWSSTEIDSNAAWMFRIYNTTHYNIKKNERHYVRPVVYYGTCPSDFILSECDSSKGSCGICDGKYKYFSCYNGLTLSGGNCVESN